MDITLHLGAHRTGATTLQRFLAGNAAILGGDGVVAWTPPRTRRGLFSGLVRRPDAISLPLERTGRRSLGVIAVQVAQLERAGMLRLIVSEQNMLGTAEECLRCERPYPWASERLQRFVPAFHARCDRVVLTIRSYDRFWSSLSAQGILSGWPVPDAARLDRLVTQPRRWRRVIEEIAAALPRAQVFVIPFEAMTGVPERQLAVLTGQSLPTGQAARMTGARDWLCRSPSPDTISEILADRGHFELVRVSSDDRWTPFDDNQHATLVAQYAEDLAWLRAGADGHATLIERAESQDLRAVQRTGGNVPDDRNENNARLG